MIPGQLRIAAGALCAALAVADVASAWLFDRGLEDTIDDMRGMLKKRDLAELYDCCVDPRLRLEIEESAEKIKADRTTGPAVSRRLRFPDYGAFMKASPAEVVAHFFKVMKDPPPKKGATIRNAEYLKTGFMLSVLFAPLDEGMTLVKREINGERARLHYQGNGLKMVAYFTRRDNRWYLTRKGL